MDATSGAGAVNNGCRCEAILSASSSICIASESAAAAAAGMMAGGSDAATAAGAAGNASVGDRTSLIAMQAVAEAAAREDWTSLIRAAVAV